MMNQIRSDAGRMARGTIGVLAAAVIVVGAVEARGDDAQAVADANAEFYAALNAMFTGDLAPMTQVWSHRNDVTYMGPGGGFEIGWEQVRAVWEQQAVRKLGGRVEPTQVRTTPGVDLAVVSVVEVGENTNADGTPARVSIRATNIFRKEDGVWKMIGHHTDLLPFLEPPQQFGSAR
jgi:ketosteroid isomerase-like protein